MASAVPRQLEDAQAMKLTAFPNEDFVEFALRAMVHLLREQGWTTQQNIAPDGSIDMNQAVTAVVANYHGKVALVEDWDCSTPDAAVMEVISTILWYVGASEFRPSTLTAFNDKYFNSLAEVCEVLQLAREGYRYWNGPYRLASAQWQE